MLSKLGQNNIDLQLVLEAINSLPEASPPEPEIPSIFGDGSNAGATISQAVTWSAETEDTGFIEKNFTTLTVTETGSISAGNRNAGMIIRVQGDCTIAGSIINQMSPKTILDSDGVDFTAKYPLSMLNNTTGSGGAGGNGGRASNNSTTGTGGAGMAGRFYGGGYSGGGGGGAYSGAAGGSSTNITTAISSIFVGGAAPSKTNVAGNPGSYGGGGGGGASGYSSYGSGGSGAGGTGGRGGSYGGGGGGAGNYGGGVIILLVGGNLTITGTIDCSGCTGGTGGAAGGGVGAGGYGGAGGGGGGGGGGYIFICHRGDISNTGTLNVNGGAGGSTGSYSSSYPNSAGTAGSAGGIGSTAVKTYEKYMEEDVA